MTNFEWSIKNFSCNCNKLWVNLSNFAVFPPPLFGLWLWLALVFLAVRGKARPGLVSSGLANLLPCAEFGPSLFLVCSMLL